MRFDDVIGQAVDIAAEIIQDGAADELTLTDLIRARVELTNHSGRWVEALSEVVALGAEYVCNVGDPDERELRDELASFAGAEDGAANAAHAWLQFLEHERTGT